MSNREISTRFSILLRNQIDDLAKLTQHINNKISIDDYTTEQVYDLGVVIGNMAGIAFYTDIDSQVYSNFCMKAATQLVSHNDSAVTWACNEISWARTPERVIEIMRKFIEIYTSETEEVKSHD